MLADVQRDAGALPAATSFGLLLFAGRYPGAAPGRGLTDAAELAQLAEAAGWGETWVAEHRFNPNLESASAPLLASFLLGATESMRVGTAAAVLSVWHPVMLAEQAAMLDHVSRGRFALGVARGMPTLDLDILGGGAARAEPSAFAEALDLLRTALAGKPVSAVSSAFSLPPVEVVPRPGPAGPPILVAANNEPTVRIAAARGLPLLLPPFAPLEAKRSILQTYRDEANRNSIDPSTVEHYHTAMVHHAASREAALAQLAHTWVPWFSQVARDTPWLQQHSPASPNQAELETMLGQQPVGTAMNIADELTHALTTLGVRRSLLIVDATGDPDQARHNVRTLAQITNSTTPPRRSAHGSQ